MHSYHNGLAGYAPEQIFHDGCPECERRGADPITALDYMDRPTFARAWRRAWQWNATAERAPGGISAAEAPVLRVLWAVQSRLNWPVGIMPEPGDYASDLDAPGQDGGEPEPFGVPDPDCPTCHGLGRVPLAQPGPEGDKRCPDCPGEPTRLLS